MPTIYGDGQQTRDFTYVENTVSANLLAMKSNKVIEGETLNIACGQSFSLLDLVSSINKKIDKDIKPKFVKSRLGDVKDSKADIKKAKKMLGYDPQVTFTEGLEKTIEWFQKK